MAITTSSSISVNAEEEAEIRRRAGKSARFMFSKVFTAVVGQSPSDYLRHLRIEEAKRLLSTTSDSITDIAAAVGFNQAAYFTRVFRARTGTTPRDFRRNGVTPEEDDAAD